MGVRVGAGAGALAGAEATVGGLEAEGGGALGRTGAGAALGAAFTAPLGRGEGDCVGAGAGGFAMPRGATSGRDGAPPTPAAGIIGRGGNNTGRGAF